MSVANKPTLVLVAVIALLLFSSSSCSDEPTPSVAPSLTPATTLLPDTATAPPAPTLTANDIPSRSTSIAASATRTQRSTATSVATRSATRTATRTRRPTGTPTPTKDTALATATALVATANYLPEKGPIGGPEFPPDINPLTGLPVADTALLERNPLSIKVSNSVEVRPQAGLDKADLVFEHYSEGWITRLTAVFLGETPEMVGSVRSGRLIDLEIPAMFKALFAYSGTSAGVGQEYAKSDLWPDQLAPHGRVAGAYYRRDLPRRSEHTLFVNPVELWAEAERRGISERKDLRGMTFEEKPPPRGSPANIVEILYRLASMQVKWVFEVDDGRYYRWQGGVAHREEVSGAQLSASNVIVVGANHVYTDIVEGNYNGIISWSIEIQIWGEGPVSIFRDGRRYDGVWRRWDRHEPLSFWTTNGGQRIPLKPGNTWFQMVPLGFTGLEVSP